MSEPKHTPGPWFLFANGHCVGGPHSDPKQEVAGIAMCSLHLRTDEENKANAQLIVTAPELKNELRAYHDREWRTPHEGLPAHTADDNCEGCAACTLVAKAEGREA